MWPVTPFAQLSGFPIWCTKVLKLGSLKWKESCCSGCVMGIAHSEQLVGLNLVAYNGPRKHSWTIAHNYSCVEFSVFPFLSKLTSSESNKGVALFLFPPQWGLNFLDLGKGCTKSGVTYHSQLVSPIMIMLTYKKTIPILPLLFVFHLYLVIPIDKNTYRYNSNTYETLHCKQWACS